MPYVLNLLFTLISGHLAKRIGGHVTDSFTHVESMATGISSSFTQFKPVQQAIKKPLDFYMETFPETFTGLWKRGVDTYITNPLKIPTLFIYSRGDSISSVKWPLTSLAHQKKFNIPAFHHEFDSDHCQHFRHYPEKYSQLLDNFINFTQVQVQK